MFCRKCGKQIPDGMTLCEQCTALEGATAPLTSEPVTEAPAQEAAAPVAVADPTAPAPKARKLSKKAITIGVAILAAVAVLVTTVIVLFSTVFNRLNLTEYIKITGAEGYNGYASLTVEIDFDGLTEALKFEKKGDIKKLQKLIEEGEVTTPLTKEDVEAIEEEYDLNLKELRKLYGAVDIEIENNGSLKNGDTVKLVIEADEDADLKKKLIGGELTYEVKDLAELKKLSLGEVFDVHFSGMNGDGSATLERKEYDSWKSAVECSIDKDVDLSNGDTVTLTLKISDYEYESYYAQMLESGYELPKTEKKTVTVDGLDSYLTKDKITDDVINAAVSRTREYFGDADQWKLGKVYFLKAKNDDLGGRYDNYIIVTFSQPGSYWTLNRAIGLQNNLVDSEGNVKLTEYRTYITSGTDYTEAEMLERIRDYYADNYTIDTLK